MVYIPFPRLDLNANADLVAWRAKTTYTENEWSVLKPFLAKQARFIDGLHPLPKCWYSELPQGDNYALDVEHFRPKNRAAPLRQDQLKALEKYTKIELRQANTEGAYRWLEFDYRNYRLVTALTNRGGAKHVFFPIVENTNRLNANELPWQTTEYQYFLDPADAHDASLLLVLPNGEIHPRTDYAALTDTDFANLPHSWHSDGFNYIRAAVTIQLYRLDDRIFQVGRKEVYDKVNDLMTRLEDCFPTDNERFERLRDGFIRDLFYATLPSAPFALAARCALKAYLPPANAPDDLKNALIAVTHKILNKVENEVATYTRSWA